MKPDTTEGRLRKWRLREENRIAMAQEAIAGIDRALAALRPPCEHVWYQASGVMERLCRKCNAKSMSAEITPKSALGGPSVDAATRATASAAKRAPQEADMTPPPGCNVATRDQVLKTEEPGRG